MANSPFIHRLSVVFADDREARDGAKWWSISPAFVGLRALTHKSRPYISQSRRPSFPVLMLLSQELCHPSLFSSPMPLPESGAPLIPGCRLCGFQSPCRVMQLASRGECDRARAGAGQQLGRFRVFFFLYFRKKLHAQATRIKEIITVA